MELTTRYLGLSLKNPLVAGAGPVTGKLDNIRRLEDLGAGAVVLPSIFEEQITQEDRLMVRLTTLGVDSHSEALSYFPSAAIYPTDPRRYLDLLYRSSRAVDIPVIGSLNGISEHGWIDYARQIEAAGADAIELNIYFIPADIEMSGEDVERRYLSILGAVKQAVKIPVAVKLSPYFSAIGNMARQLVQSGASGLVMFNRFYEPDIDLRELKLLHNLELSSSAEIRLPLLWIAVLSGRIQASLAANSGVETEDEVIKYLLAGADVVMTTSALLKHGVRYIKVLLEGLKDWLIARELDSLEHIRGRLSQRSVANPTAFERANYIEILQGYESNR